MSNITIAGDAVGTGTFTVASPATNTNRIITLPDQTDTLATAADVSAALTAASATQLGVGQTWQNVAGSRARATSYQNNTGRPIMISGVTSGTGTSTWEVSSNNSTWVIVGLATSNGVAQNTSFVVPATWYYRVNSASASIDYWAELR